VAWSYRSGKGKKITWRGFQTGIIVEWGSVDRGEALGHKNARKVEWLIARGEKKLGGRFWGRSQYKEDREACRGGKGRLELRVIGGGRLRRQPSVQTITKVGNWISAVQGRPKKSWGVQACWVGGRR